MKGLALDKFKKVQEDEKSAVLQHPDGHKISIAKTALSEKMRHDLGKLPLHAASGSGVIPSALARPEDYEAPPEDIVNAQIPKAPDIQPSSADDVFNQRVQDVMGRKMDRADQYGYTPDKAKIEQQVMNQMEQEKMSSQDRAKSDSGAIDQQNAQRSRLGLSLLPGGSQPSSQPPMSQQMPQQSGAAQPGGPFGFMNNDMYTKGLGEAASAIKQKQAIESSLGQQNKTAYDEHLQQAESAKKMYDTNMQRIMDNHVSLTNELKNGHIDPDQFLNQMGGGKKVATAIGLILGGIGGGLTGQENPALKFLQSEIERNVQGQMKSLDNKKTLLGANHEAMGDLKTAYHMSMASMNDILAAKIQKAAAQSSDPMAQQRATEALGQLHMANGDHLRQVQMQQSMLSQMGAAQQHGKQVDPAMKIRAFVGNPAEQDKYFKELKEAEEAVSARDNVLTSFDKVAKLNTASNRILNPFQTKAQIDAIKGPVVAALSKATAGRFTEQDAALLDPIFKNVFDNPGTVQQKKAEVLRLIGEKMHYPMLRNLGIDVNQMGKYNPQGQGRIQEAPPMLRK